MVAFTCRSLASPQTFALSCALLISLMVMTLLGGSALALWRVAQRWIGHHPRLAQRFEAGFWLLFGVVGILLSFLLASRT